MTDRRPPPLAFPKECCHCNNPRPESSFPLRTDTIQYSVFFATQVTEWRRAEVPICLSCKQLVYEEKDGRLWRYFRKILIGLGSVFVVSQAARTAMSQVGFAHPLNSVAQLVGFLAPMAMMISVIILIPAAFIYLARRENSDRYQMFIFRKLAGYDWKGDLRFGNAVFAAKVHAMNPAREWRS